MHSRFLDQSICRGLPGKSQGIQEARMEGLDLVGPGGEQWCSPNIEE